MISSVIITMGLAAGTVLSLAFEKKLKKKNTEESMLISLLGILREILIIIFSAMLALWLTNNNQSSQSKKQLNGYFETGIVQNQELINAVNRLMCPYSDVFSTPEEELRNAMDSLLSGGRFDENSFNYSDIPMRYASPELLTELTRYVRQRDDEIERLRTCYETDQAITPRVFLELYHVSVYASLALTTYQYQIEYLTGSKTPNLTTYTETCRAITSPVLDSTPQTAKIPEEHLESAKRFFEAFPCAYDWTWMSHAFCSIYTGNDNPGWDEVNAKNK